ncbi:MAG: leucine-rich repeat protein, partial [Oscillospiraceae bacterium]|nr:leucine-rich repeat protein [Oscillospiraceae bacterium]
MTNPSTKRFLSLLLALCLCLALLPAGAAGENAEAFAEEAENAEEAMQIAENPESTEPPEITESPEGAEGPESEPLLGSTKITLNPASDSDLEPVSGSDLVPASGSDLYALLYSDGELVIQTGSRVASGWSLLDGTEAWNLQDLGILENGLPSYNTAWRNFASSIKKVTIMVAIAPESTAYWFYDCRNLAEISGLSRLNTSNVTDMRDMFSNCSSLTSLDLSGFDTSKVTDMSYMFYNCSSLTSLNLSSFDTSGVTTMYYMFYNCGSLTSLNLSGFDTSSVTTMYEMFGNCSSLTSLNLSSFDTSGVTTMYYMFYNCSSLTSLDLSSFDTSKVTSFYYMFSNCSKLRTISASIRFATGSSSSSMFSNCTALAGGAGTTFDSAHTSADYARIDGGAAAPGYFTAKGSASVGGSVGSGLSWTLDNTGVLRLSGSGATGNFYEANDASKRISTPWEPYQNIITALELNGVTDIGDFAFCNLGYLTRVTIPNTVTRIGRYAFESCARLNYVFIPASVTTVATNPFARCPSLEAISLDSGSRSLKVQDGVLFNYGMTRLLSYPAGKSGSYTIPSTVTGFGNNTFDGNTKLTELIFPEGATAVAFAACYGCTALKSVTLPASIQSVGNVAFYQTALTDVYYGGDESQWSAVSIGANNEKLTSATFHYSSKPTTYTVTFNANGGSGTMAAQTFTAGEGIMLNANSFTRSGYTFNGWNTVANGSGTSYADRASVSPGANLTLYAQWTPKPIYTVTFNANGGSGTMSPQTVTAGDAITLNANSFTRSGYTFSGWNTAANGSGTSYADRASVSPGANLTLYAQWTPKPIYTVT